MGGGKEARTERGRYLGGPDGARWTCQLVMRADRRPPAAMTSLYRRHRPQTFADVVGQAAIVRTMSNAVSSGKVHHAYLFVGARGTGKTSVAKILARSLNCVNGPTLEPCGECESCTAITNSTSLDVIEMDAASNNSVDDIRDLREKVGFAPAGERSWKVYILDEAHMLSKQAWNAFLKTLEEPPPNTIFVLATTEAHKVLATIVDRCHRFDFQRPSLEQITTVLQRIADAEGIEADGRALAMIARSAGGSFRDAIGTLDQLVTYGGKQVSFDDVLELLDVADADLIFAATDAVIARDPAGALRRVQELSESGRDPVQFMRDLTAHLRHLIVVQTLGEPPDSFSVTADQVPRLEAQARDLPQADAVRSDRPARRRDRAGEGGLRPAHAARGRAAEGGAAERRRVDRGAADADRAPRARRARAPPPDEPRVTQAPTRSAAARASRACAGRSGAAPPPRPSCRRCGPRCSSGWARARAARCWPRCWPTRARSRSRRTCSCSPIRRRPRSASARSRIAPTASASGARSSSSPAARTACGFELSEDEQAAAAGSRPAHRGRVDRALQERVRRRGRGPQAAARGGLRRGAACPSPT